MASPSGKDPEPGGGIRNTRTTHAFRAINFELFAKPVSPVSRSLMLVGSRVIGPTVIISTCLSVIFLGPGF